MGHPPKSHQSHVTWQHEVLSGFDLLDVDTRGRCGGAGPVFFLLETQEEFVFAIGPGYHSRDGGEWGVSEPGVCFGLQDSCGVGAED